MTKRLIIATLVSAVALTSCNKGTISSKRLDGTWKLTSGKVTDVSKRSDLNGVLLLTTTTVNNYNGTTNAYTTTSSSSSIPASSGTDNYTAQYTFSKSDDTYTKVEVGTETSTYSDYLFSDSGCNNYISGGQTKATTTTEATTKGTYTILGSTGDIEKNTRMLLEITSESDKTTTTYSYLSGTTVLTSVYVSDNGCKAAPTTETASTTDPVVADMGSIVTVSESSSSEMTVAIKTSRISTGTNSKTTYTSDGTMVYTKQ